MGAGQKADADNVDVLLHRRIHDFLRRPVQAGVDDVHARVAEAARDDLDSPIVSVKSYLGDQDPDYIPFLVHLPSPLVERVTRSFRRPVARARHAIPKLCFRML